MHRTLSAHRVLPVLFLAFAAAGCGTGALKDVRSYDTAVLRNLGSEVNSTYDDFASSLLDNRLYFTSNRPTAEGYIQGDDFWFADLERGQWSQALNYGGTVNTPRDEGAPFVSADGGTIIYTQCWNEDGLGDADIYTASLDAQGKWQRIQNLGELVNTKYWDSNPTISTDGEEMFFSSDRPGGFGGTDLWVSKRLRNGKWGTAKNLGPGVNTSDDEKGPYLSPAGTELYFSSTGHPGLGGHDLFVSVRDTKKGWLPPTNIGRPFNSSADDLFFRVSALEDTVYITSNRDGGLGGYDLYAIGPNPFKDTARYTFYVSLSVTDTLTRSGIGGARVRIAREDGSVDSTITDKKGILRFRTKLGQKYTFDVSAKNYLPASKSATVPMSLSTREYRVRVGLPPILPEAPKAETKPDHPIVYFEFDKADISDEYATDLAAWYASALQKLVEAKIDFDLELNAHTDDVGTVEYNTALSRRRGAAVSKALSGMGVPRANISVNAYGETKPVDENESEEGRKHNRRVELLLLSEPPK
ncbi:MAG: PD40 domain-containing protein [Ignavibacteria bacterium]|nr:PD40 domain-containing protein [Ignavibacteria bacterium]